MISVKVFASILLFLTFIHAFPLTLDDSSVQRSNLVVRQTTPPTSVAATGSESLNLTGLVDTFEGLVVDLQGVGEVLRNLTKTLERDISKISVNVLQSVLPQLTRFIRVFADLIERIDNLPMINGPEPSKRLSDALLESLKNLLGSLNDLRDTLFGFSLRDLNDLRNIFKTLKGAVNALIAVLTATTKLMAAVESIDKVPAGELNKVLNDLAGLSNNLAGLKGALGVLGGFFGLSL